MPRADRSRRLFGMSVGYVPRVLAGAIALFSLLVSHQLIWTAFADLTIVNFARQSWIFTNLSNESAFDLLSGHRPTVLTTKNPQIEVAVVAPPDGPTELFHNGAPVSLLYGPGPRTARLTLRRGENFLVAASPPARDSAGRDARELLRIVYESPATSAPVVLAWRQVGMAIEVVGLGDPNAEVHLRSGNQEGTTWTRGVGGFLASLPAPDAGEDVSIEARADASPWSRTSPVPWAAGAAGFTPAEPGRSLHRQIVFGVEPGYLQINATVHIPPGTYLAEMVASRLITGDEFIRDVFGLCVEPDDWDAIDRVGLLACWQAPGIREAREPALDMDDQGRVTANRRLPLSLGRLTIRGAAGISGLGATFPSLPDDKLRVVSAALVAARVEWFDTGYRTTEAGVEWVASRNPNAELGFHGPIFSVDPRADAGAVDLSVTSDTSGVEPRPRLIDRVRALERVVPQKVREVFSSLLAGLPFLYVLWIVHTFSTRFQARTATLKAVTLTFLMVHVSILAAGFFSASLSRPMLDQLSALLPTDARFRVTSVLHRASYIHPFLTIGIVLLVHPVFQALHRSALQPPPRPSRLARGAGWCVFWIAVVGIPAVAVWEFVQSGSTGVVMSPTNPFGGMPLRYGLVAAFLGLWFVLYWLFRGVLRIDVSAGHAWLASWAMLILPIVPLVLERLNAFARDAVATEFRMYPFMFPDRASPYIAAAIITLLGAILLRRTGRLTVRLSHFAPARLWWRTHPRAILLVALVVSIPVAIELREASVFGITTFLSGMDFLLPYTMLVGAGLLVRLHNPGDQFALPPAVLHVGALLFAWYVVPSGASLVFVPIPFLMAWFLFRRWLIAQVTPSAPTTEPVLVAFLEERRAKTRLESLQKGLDKKMAEGNLTVAIHATRLNDGRAAWAAAVAALRTATGGATARVFGHGPETSPWQNARVAVSYGIAISAPFQLLTLIRMLNDGWGTGTFPLLEFSLALLYSMTAWTVMAAVFGYFFHVIRGRNGFEKALAFAFCAVLPAIPLRLVEQQSVASPFQILDAIQVLAFLLVLALTAFDLRTLQKHRFGWRELMTVYGLASAAYASTVAVAIASSLGGREILTNLWEMVKSLAN